MCIVFFFKVYGSFLSKGSIMCGVAVTLRIMMATFSMSVRLCCAGISNCIRGCRQAGKAGQLIR